MSTRLQCEMSVGRKFIVVEFLTIEIPHAASRQDDRPLGIDGTFLEPPYSRLEVAEFESEKEAWAAVKRAQRRLGGMAGVFERG